MQELTLNAGYWGLWPALLGTAAVSFVVLAAAELPFTASRALTLSVREESSRYAHLARQLLVLCRAAAWLLTACIAIALFTPGMRDWAPALPVSHMRIMGGASAAAALLCTLTVSEWKHLARSRRFLARMTGLCLLGAVLTGVCALLKTFFPEYMQALRFLILHGFASSETTANDFYRLCQAALPVLAALAAVTALPAAGAGAALPWLLLRRKADDFGRDYYAFALRWCARRASTGVFPLLLGTGLAAFASLFLYITPATTGLVPVEMGYNVAGGLFRLSLWIAALAGGGADIADPITAALLITLFGVLSNLMLLAWRKVHKAEVPMRAKAAVWIAPVFLIFALTCALMLMAPARLLPGTGI